MFKQKKTQKKTKHNSAFTKKNIYVSKEKKKKENALLFTKVPIRPTKTGGSYVSVFDFRFFSFYLLFT